MSAALDRNRTAAFTLGPPVAEARAGVLLLHGFTGSPWELRLLAESLAAKGLHVRVPRLPGHGGTPEDLLWVTWPDWERAAVEAHGELSSARRVVVGGLSMGALLAVALGARLQHRVDGLLLMAPMLQFRALEGRVFRLLRGRGIEGLLPRWLSKTSVDLEDAEQRRQAPLLARYPVERLRDLCALQELAWSQRAALRAPSLVVIAESDHLVLNRAVERFQRGLPSSRLLRLRRGFHQVARDFDRALLFSEVGRFVESLAIAPGGAVGDLG
jgi:carboxylesterase